MSVAKIAISVERELFDAAEALSTQLRISRSELYARALREFVNLQGAREITANLDRVYLVAHSRIDPALKRAQFDALPDEAW